MTRLALVPLLLAASLASADSVTLLEGGPNKIQVVKVIRDATGLGLKDCKDLVEGAPRLVKQGLTPEAAATLAKQLIDVGAKAQVHADGTLAKPAAPTPPPAGSWAVKLEAIGPEKIMIIKLVREATGLGLKDTKDLVERAPTTVKSGLSQDAAKELAAKLEAAGARASTQQAK